VEHRLQADRIVLLFSVRDLSQASFIQDLPALHIGGLPDEDAITVLAQAARSPVDPKTARRVAATCRVRC